MDHWFAPSNLLLLRKHSPLARLNLMNQLVQNPLAAIAFLALAAILEAFGDACFQAALYDTVGWASAAAALSGAIVLLGYGIMVNLPRWDFGRLIGVYVAVFFVSAQIINRIRFGHAPTPPVYTGGALIIAGGLVMTFWNA
jgi:small multidrug resistance family-3 protein